MPGERILAGKVALVTGAGRGLGPRLRRASRGAGLQGRRPRPARGRPRRVRRGHHPDGDRGGDRRTARRRHVAGARRPDAAEDIARVVARVESALGPVDILVHNAGGDIGAAGGKPDPNDAIAIPPADTRAVIERNLMSTIFLCQHVAPGMMARRHGRIVTISSTAAFRGRTSGAIYATAKAAAVQYTRCLAEQLRPYGVTANSIAPGDTRTGRFLNTRTVEPATPRRRRHARPHRARRRGRARGGAVRRADGRFHHRPGPARRRRRPGLAGVDHASNTIICRTVLPEARRSKPSLMSSSRSFSESRRSTGSLPC
jgi:3-oxoacyl-[acyl-carrier protein] reductase